MLFLYGFVPLALRQAILNSWPAGTGVVTWKQEEKPVGKSIFGLEPTDSNSAPRHP